MTTRKLAISKAAELLGVSVSTLRKWEADGRLIPERTAGGQRRYDLALIAGASARGDDELLLLAVDFLISVREGNAKVARAINSRIQQVLVATVV